MSPHAVQNIQGARCDVRVKETHEPHGLRHEPCNGAPEKKSCGGFVNAGYARLGIRKGASGRPRNLSRKLFGLLASISQLPHEACAPLPVAVLLKEDLGVRH